MHQQLQGPARNVKATIEYTCEALRSLGIESLTAETLRQAKFNIAQVDTLWRALHDVVVLQLASFPPNRPAAKLRAFWSRVQEESVDDAFPPEAADLVRDYLLQWGYAEPGFYKLPADGPISRVLLLALGWLLAHCRIFERALARRLAGYELTAPLPPYPEDALQTAEAAHAGESAAAEARSYVQRLASASQPGPPTSASSGRTSSAPGSEPGPSGRSASGSEPGPWTSARTSSVRASKPGPPGRSASGSETGPAGRSTAPGFEPGPSGGSASGGWARVEARSQQALLLWGKVGARLRSLAGLQQARRRYLHSIQELQWSHLQNHPQLARQQAPLTAYELSLATSARQLARHASCLDSAAAIASACGECEAHASVFFAWMASVLNAHTAAEATAGLQVGNRPGKLPLSFVVSVDRAALLRSTEMSSAQLEAAAQQLHNQLGTMADESAGSATARELVESTAEGSEHRDSSLQELQWSIRDLLAGVPQHCRGSATLPLPPDLAEATAAAEAAAFATAPAASAPWRSAKHPPRVELKCLAYRQPEMAQAPGVGVLEDSRPALQAELDRLKAEVLVAARALARTRAAHRHSFEAAAVQLTQSGDMVVGTARR